MHTIFPVHCAALARSTAHGRARYGRLFSIYTDHEEKESNANQLSTKHLPLNAVLWAFAAEIAQYVKSQRRLRDAKQGRAAGVAADIYSKIMLRLEDAGLPPNVLGCVF